jgi:cytoskeletal protein RodZ
MDKNRSIALMVLIICIIVGVFLYFVFRPNTSNEMIQEDTSNQSEDVANYVEAEDWESIMNNAQDVEEYMENAVPQDSIVQNSEVEINEKTIDLEVVKSSPETGPGSIALLIAIVIATIFSFVVYKKQNITNM